MAAGVENSRWKLPSELIALSRGDKWPSVLKEWKLDYIEKLEGDEDSETCLCHHTPIREVCHISNKFNHEKAIVGNCCVTKFEEEKEWGSKGTHKVFDAFKRIQKDNSASANPELLQYAFDHRIITEFDHTFYLDIWRKRALTYDQSRRKALLNSKITAAIASKSQATAVAPAQQAAPHIASIQTSPPRFDNNVSTSSSSSSSSIPSWSAPVQAVATRTLAEAVQLLREGKVTLADRIVIVYARDQNVILAKDYEFYSSILDRNVRRPSEKQQKWIDDIHAKILRAL